jgi:acyl carrier protein
VHVLDRQLSPVPVGVAGELWIGGAQLARGYAGRPAQTAERFVADPLAGDGSRAYRSGDRGRWRADGQLEFVGRADDQVKIRGFRVEPVEVQAVLAAHPGVAAAAVTADGNEADRRLVAYLVPADPSLGVPPTGELREFMAKRLPAFMIPAVFTELAALPLTASGKLDKASLPAPEGARPELARGYVAPSTPTEELLARIWAQVLGLDKVGIHDNFFELGGHSLRAVEVVSGIRSEFGVEFRIAAFFDEPTIAEIAVAINKSTVGIDGEGQRYDEFEF